jgi:hypothetical protein
LRSTATAHVVRRLDAALTQAGAALDDAALVMAGEGRLRVRRLPLGT